MVHIHGIGGELAKDIQSAPIHKFGEYEYPVYSVAENGTILGSALIQEVAAGYRKMVSDFTTVDVVVTIAPGGTQWGLLVAENLNKPLIIVRPYPNRGAKGTTERTIEEVLQSSNAQSVLTVGTRVLIVDDVVSTGGTVRKVVSALSSYHATILGVVVAIAKGDGAQSLENDLKFPVHCLAQV